MFFPIPDPTFFHPGSRIRLKEFKYFNPKKWFLRSRNYDPGCSSRIPDQEPDLLPIPGPGSQIPDPGSRGQKGTGFATLLSSDLAISMVMVIMTNVSFFLSLYTTVCESQGVQGTLLKN
jgi:hypothetical protein